MPESAGGSVEILDHLPEEHVDAALSILHEAFANKFRHGFRRPEEFVRFFRRDVRRADCFCAVAEGRLLGIVTISHTQRRSGARSREFYDVSLWRLLTTFNPLHTLRILFNLFLLSESPAPEQFMVESIAVSADARGLGVGTMLLDACEQLAREEGFPLLALDVIGENVAARRLYERLGYQVTRTTSGFWVRLATLDDTVHRMELPLNAER